MWPIVVLVPSKVSNTLQLAGYLVWFTEHATCYTVIPFGGWEFNLLSCTCLAPSPATCNMLKLLQNIWHRAQGTHATRHMALPPAPPGSWIPLAISCTRSQMTSRQCRRCFVGREAHTLVRFDASTLCKTFLDQPAAARPGRANGKIFIQHLQWNFAFRG